MWIFINPMLKFINSGYPWKYGNCSYQLVLFSPPQIFLIIKKYLPVIHSEQFHRHAGYFGYFHRVILKCIQLQVMCKKGLNSMPSFVYHGGYVMHLAGSIHKNKRSTTFRQRTVVAAGSFAIPAFQVEVPHGIHAL